MPHSQKMIIQTNNLLILLSTFDILKSLQSPDGRKDFMARKFCNMFETMQVV